MARAVVVLLIAIVAVAGLYAVTPSPQQITVPVLPTERDEFGGRPGSFHFVTNEQMMAEAAEMQTMVATVERMKADVATLRGDQSTKQRVRDGLDKLSQFLPTMHARRSQPAGTTAAEIEKNLNAAKGKYMCGACHGHGGMMRGMHAGAGPS